jgi:hypothetical protein
MIISVSHPELENYKIVSGEQTFINQSAVLLPIDLTVVNIYFEPFKIKPLLRIDNILINYWLANVIQYDHMLELPISDDFWIKYYNKETESQINFAKLNHANDPMAVDKYVGISDSSEIIARIRKRLNG